MKFSRQRTNKAISPNSNGSSGDSFLIPLLRQILLAALFGATVIWGSFILSSSSQNSSSSILTSKSSSTKTLRSGVGGGVCRYYLAESALPRSGLGLFTTVDIAEGEMAQPLIDHCVYVADRPEGTHFHTHAWSRGPFFGTWEGDNPWAACEGFATLVNSVPDGRQTSQLRLVHAHHNAGLTRTESPGAGAITHYYGVTSEAIREIKAGSEITIDYGDWTYRDDDYKRLIPVRDVSWLRKYGMCIDYIRSKTATDPSMGRGAFAAYNIRRGSEVAPGPLQVFRDRKMFAQQEPEALFVNYCFLVGEDMLLYPYGPGVTLINHSQKPNVGIRWSKNYMHHSSWLELPLEVYLQTHDYPGGLILEYYALRDIKQDEELFIDYGDNWQAAWDRHKASWQPVTGDGYVYPQDMSRDKIPTTKEQKDNPLPPNIITVCWTKRWNPKEDVITLPWEVPDYKWPEGMIDCEILKRRSVSVSTSTGETKNTYVYDVKLDLRDGRKFIETDVPSEAIYFVDKPYTSDMHLPNAFRQPMTFPVDLIPDSWK